MIETGCVLNGKPVLAEIFFWVPFLSEFIELGEDSWGQHVFNVDTTCSFGIKEEEELSDSSHDVFIFEVVIHILEVDEGGDELANVFIEVCFCEIAVSCGIV